jgi:hypothetical protein
MKYLSYANLVRPSSPHLLTRRGLGGVFAFVSFENKAQAQKTMEKVGRGFMRTQLSDLTFFFQSPEDDLFLH